MANMYPSKLASGMTETVLWTNPNPTTSYSTGTVTVSSMTEYDFIKIVFRKTTSDSTEIPYIVPLSTFETMLDEAKASFLGAGYKISTTIVCRPTYYSSSTSVYFSNCKQLGGSDSSRNSMIPYKIIGIKI